MKYLTLMGLGCLAVACATTKPAVSQLSNDGSQVTVQLSQDKNSLLASKSSTAALKSSEELKKRSNLTTPLLNSIAELELIGGKPDEAALQARNQLKKDFKNVDAMKTLVKVSLIKERPEEAILMANNAQSIDPKDPDLFNLKGVAYFMKNEHLSARESWKRALELSATNISAQMNLAALFFLNANFSAAGAGFEKVLAMQPQNLDAQVGKALVLSVQGNAEDARKLLEASLEKNPKSSLLLYNLALIERDRFENNEKSLAYMERHIQTVGKERYGLERAIALREDLKNRISSNGKNRLTDEQLTAIAQKAVDERERREVKQPATQTAVNIPSEEKVESNAQEERVNIKPASLKKKKQEEYKQENVNDLENAIK